ncbi:MAG: ATP-dependent DNA ligase [Acidimicrobiia bacterium]|nr:ATP-dependent DNA ligase [Acidimicrobiia bacterium]MDH4306595.1 ATP-dependent DNA ligase [Acidimicrobiia bacterium]MDH5294674.1 ATP-dependent DNA ligase [Acidimicrobiia bacterium]
MEDVIVEIDGDPLVITHPDKVMFPKQGWTKFDVVQHFLTCVDGALAGVFGRPTMLKRWPSGVEAKPFFQKRAPKSATERYTVEFPSGRTAGYLVPRAPFDVIWMAQLNCIDLNPWSTRVEQVEFPDELRIDLDPTPEATWADVQQTALVVNEVLTDHGLVGYPKTSGSKGIHVYVRMEPQYPFLEVRRAALALGREVARRRPDLATTEWWKDNRHGVFLDYNQNSRDRTVASAYSVRPTGWVSAPLTWDEVPAAELADFPMGTFAARYETVGDLMEPIDDVAFSLDSLLELARRDEAGDLAGDPWPPNFGKPRGRRSWWGQDWEQ